jgi:hypothetical protein
VLEEALMTLMDGLRIGAARPAHERSTPAEESQS